VPTRPHIFLVHNSFYTISLLYNMSNAVDRGRLSAGSSSTSPPTRLRDLPIELVEHLLSQVAHPADLLSLALCNHALYNIIVSDYLSWHSISVPSQNRCIVSKFCSNRRTAQLVKRLIITDTWTTTGHAYRLCSSGDAQDPVVVDYAMWEKCAANLTALRSLVLHVRDVGKWKPFLNIVRHASPELRDIALQQYLGFMYRFRIDPESAISVLDEVRDIHEFDWYSALAQGSELFVVLTQTLSHNASTIRSIKINISSEDTASTLFWALRFPHLRSCQILNVHGSRHVGLFLSAHPDLEVFHLHTSSGLRFDILPDVLPKARDVDLRYYGYPELFIRLVQPLPDGSRRPLESIGICAQALGRRWGIEDALDVFCRNLAEIKTVRSLTWIDLSHSLSESRFLSPVARACPEVTEVVFAWNLPTGPSLTMLCDALAEMPHLSTIRCPSSSLVPYELVCQAEVLGRACRNLQRLNDCVRVDDGWRVVKDGRAFWERVTL